MDDVEYDVAAGQVGGRHDAAAVLERVAPIVRRALVARYGIDAGSEAAADAIAWGWEHDEALVAMTNPGGYLYRVGQTAARRAGRRAARSAFPIEPIWHDAPDLPGDVFDALHRLKPDQRVAVMLVHSYGFTYREAADVMEVSESAITNHVHRGMQRLRADLSQSNRKGL